MGLDGLVLLTREGKKRLLCHSEHAPCAAGAIVESVSMVKSLSCGSAKGGSLFRDARLIEHGLGVEHSLLGRLKDSVHAA